MSGTFSKRMQQYVTNPNYYTSSPDTPLFKLIQDIELLEEDITFGEVIGEGCFGTVYKGTYRQSDSTITQVAIKVLKDKKESKDDFEREIEIISTFNHKNIIKLIGVVVTDSDLIPYMVFEYMMFGDLAELLRTKKVIQPSHCQTIDDQPNKDPILITHDLLIWISTQIANGCKYLADNHFVHRDLATRNCLVGHDLTVKISDFGMSRDIYTCDYYKVGGSKLLPVRWMSPESILYGKFTLESDVWSFGVVLWEVFTLAKQPYFGHNNEEVVKLILQGILLIPPEDCPQIIYELMANCWKTEPIHRINFQTIFHKLY
ncbi:tyrosine-protein kinase transmembrane receptor Ror-like, partial [Oppia nitens]|uniref:tyrosine-protein kinase transmembrane receptor Ror-like n=1 Tax=Oppia nitens TaxID=1686743 RepID=UPI0023DA4841